MPVLRIEHPVPDFNRWKEAFDSDPVGRERSGVRRYRVMRGVEDPNYVLIDLEFDTQEQADGLLAGMRRVWGMADHQVTSDQLARIVEVVDNKEY